MSGGKKGELKSLIEAVRKRAVGYKASEKIDEYALIDGELTVSKRKVTTKDIPPDMAAAKLLIELNEEGYESWSDERLKEERLRLIKIIKENSEDAVD